MKNDPDFRESVWIPGTVPPSYSQLTDNIEVDVAIIGGGITGITAAWLLAKAGKKVVVLEAHRIGLGATAFSTGNLYEVVGEKIHSVKTRHDKETLENVIESRRSAIDFIEARAKSDAIDCGFQRVPWNYFTTATSEKKKKETSEIIENEYETAREINLSASSSVPAGFPFATVSKLVQIPNQAQINPYSYVVNLAKSINRENCRIYENTQVINVEDGEPCLAYTAHAKIIARKIIMATHSPKGIYQVHTEMEAHREFAIAAKLNEGLPPNAIYWNLTDTEKYSVRPFSNHEGDYLVATGDPYLVGTKTDNEECLMNIENYLRANFNVQSIVYRWAAQNYKPADGLPYIGTSPLQTNTYIATGFQADGLVYGTLASMLITDEILGVSGKWKDLYSPTRFTPLTSAKQFLKENVSVVTHLVKDYLVYGEVDEVKEIKPGEGKTLTIDGEKLAAYRDEENQLHLVSAVCTHLGCIVHFNKTEKSWDCPCHGSRFTTSGDVIEGPAYKNLAPPEQPKEK